MAFFFTLLYIAVSLLSSAVLPEGMAAMHVSRVIGALAILTALPKLSKSRLFKLPETYLLLGLIAAAAVSILAMGWVGGALETLEAFIPVAMAFYFIVVSCDSLRRLRILIAVLTCAALVILTEAMRAYLAGTLPNPYLLAEGPTLIRIRGLGVLADPNDLAQLFVTLTPLLWIRWASRRYVANLLFTILPTLALVAGIFFTHSRGATIALLLVILFGLKDRLGVATSSLLTGVALSLLLALNIAGGRGMNEDDGGRVASWSTGLQIIKSYPLFGVGMGKFGDHNETGLTAHNSYVVAISEIGIVGYFFWIGMLVFSWRGTERAITISQRKQLEVPIGIVTDGLAVPTPDFNMIGTRSNASLWVGMAEQGTQNGPRPTNSDQVVHAGLVAELDQGVVSRTARLLRVSLVGFLACGFFLSRAFSMLLYIVLALLVSLREIHDRQSPQRTDSTAHMIKITLLIIAASISFIYVFVRVHGVR